MNESADLTEIEISADLLAKLERLPDTKMGYAALLFTPQQDKILLEYWKRKPQEDVARIVGYGVKKCKRRYIELTEGEK